MSNRIKVLKIKYLGWGIVGAMKIIGLNLNNPTFAKVEYYRYYVKQD